MNWLTHPGFGILILRCSLGGLILLHGIDKINHPGSVNFIFTQLSHIGLPEQLGYGVYLGEVLAPLMLILGWYCRAGALLIVANMLFAIGLFHLNELSALNGQGGWALELQGLYLAGALTLLLSGSGWLAYRPD